jgi:hypothetical protein
MVFTAGCTAFEGTPSLKVSKQTDSLDQYAIEKGGFAERAVPESEIENPGVLSGNNALKNQISEQKIIRTADISLEVSNVSVSADEIEDLAIKSGGIVQSSSINAVNPDRFSGSITLRIPADGFDLVLPKILDLGKLISSSIKADDVTEEYVDLEAQKTALSNQLNQYNLIMQKAQNISDILEIQKQIERVMVELDRITGKMKYLENRVAYATITISLREPAQVAAPGAFSVPEVITEGIAGFVDTVVLIFVWLLTLLPLIIIGAVGYLAYRRWKRSKVS